MEDRDLSEAVKRIEREFADMPGLKLTGAQVHRLCGIAPEMCQTALDHLTDAGTLHRSSDGAFLRARRHSIKDR
jgi:hypothetical protein